MAINGRRHWVFWEGYFFTYRGTHWYCYSFKLCGHWHCWYSSSSVVCRFGNTRPRARVVPCFHALGFDYLSLLVVATERTGTEDQWNKEKNPFLFLSWYASHPYPFLRTVPFRSRFLSFPCFILKSTRGFCGDIRYCNPETKMQLPHCASTTPLTYCRRRKWFAALCGITLIASCGILQIFSRTFDSVLPSSTDIAVFADTLHTITMTWRFMSVYILLY